MLSVKTVDVTLRVEASVHNKLGLAKTQDIQILKKMLHRLGTRYVPGELTIIKGQSRLLSKDQKEVDLREFIILFILAPLNLI
mgnify:CR=1 FL=1